MLDVLIKETSCIIEILWIVLRKSPEMEGRTDTALAIGFYSDTLNQGSRNTTLETPNLPVSHSFTVFTSLQGVECRVHCSLLVGVDSWK